MSAKQHLSLPCTYALGHPILKYIYKTTILKSLWTIFLPQILCELLDVVILERIINWHDRMIVFFLQGIEGAVWGWDTSAPDFGEWLWLWINMMVELTSTHIKVQGLMDEVYYSHIWLKVIKDYIYKYIYIQVNIFITITYMLQVGVFCGINHLRDHIRSLNRIYMRF